MKNTFSLLFLLLLSQTMFARKVNVADHGIVPGKDATLKLNTLLEELAGEEDITLYFPKGEYQFYPENAIEEYREVTNHENGLRRMAFRLFNFKNFTLDGGGSTFLFYGRICPIISDGTKGLTLKNFIIDWDTPFHHEFKVVKSDPERNTFVAEISPMKYDFDVTRGKLMLNHYNWSDVVGQNIAFDPKTSAPYYSTRRYQLTSKQSSKAEKVGENKVKLTNWTQEAPPVGAVLCAYGDVKKNRLAQAIHIMNTEDTQVENVTVYAAGGMALLGERSTNIHLNNFVVTSRDDRMLASRADATHFLGCKGLIHMENCKLEKMADDGINVHGAYVKVEEYMGENVFLCEISHRQQTGFVFAEAGDKVMLTSRETVLPLYETTVKKVKVLNELRMLITVENVPADLPTGLLSMENLTWYPDVKMHNNTIRNNRARAALISTKGDVVIENNYFSSQMHGILIEGDNNKWYESGGVRNVLIQNNVFENIGYGTTVGYPLNVSPLLTDTQYLGDKKYHRNVVFKNNTLKSFNGLMVHARSVKGLTVTGNTIEYSNKYPKVTKLPSFSLDYCEDVEIKNNQYKGFDFPLRVEKYSNSSKVVVKKNKGLEKPSLVTVE